MFAEKRPAGFAFSDTAFRIFILMASRRLNSDRFFTEDYTPAVYTEPAWTGSRTTRWRPCCCATTRSCGPRCNEVPNAFARVAPERLIGDVPPRGCGPAFPLSVTACAVTIQCYYLPVVNNTE